MATVAVSGTAGVGVPKNTINIGGKTIVLTLTGDTWIAAGGGSKTITYGDSDGYDEYATSSTIAAPAINVSAGQLLVALIFWQDDSTKNVSSLNDTIGNSSWTIRTKVVGDSSPITWAYCVSSGSNANNVITATFSGSWAGTKHIIVGAFTPSSGTWTFDVTNKLESAYYETGPPYIPTTTPDVTTTASAGDNELVLCGIGLNGSGSTFSAEKIKDIAATKFSDSGTANIVEAFYLIRTGGESGINGEATISVENGVSMELISFKLT